MYSVIIPVYKNEQSLPALLVALSDLAKELGNLVEVIFVVDGSPDGSHALLKECLPSCSFRSKLILHSKNFGSFAAVRTGLEHSTGSYFGVMAADLQEPPHLLTQIFEALRNGHDVVIGQRDERSDPWGQRVVSGLFWWVYQLFIQSEMPRGGADVFGCNRTVRSHLLSLKEANTTMIGLLVWLGFNRAVISYRRRPRHSGKSAWSLRRKIQYMVNSILAFSEFPLQVLLVIGAIGLIASAIGVGVLAFMKFFNSVTVSATLFNFLAIVFFGGLQSFGIGVVGLYVWRAFENTKQRPDALVMRTEEFPGS